MAVFTPVAPEQAQQLLARLDAGALLSLHAISAGIENTNYFVSSSRGDWVLTLFERLTSEQLPFYLGLMQHLARAGLPVPEPRADASGQLLHQVAGKPAALVNRLPGQHVLQADGDHCRQMGELLAQLHLAAASFAATQPNLRALDWCQATAPQVLPFITPAQRQWLQQELDLQAAQASAQAALPQAVVHADLFRDNTLWQGPADAQRVSGCVDFYFAGVDALAYDLAVVINDWCIDDASGALDAPRAQALLAAYQRVRALRSAEQAQLPSLRRRAALRFWLSRLADWHLPRNAALLAPKDPAHFERVLRCCNAQPPLPG